MWLAHITEVFHSNVLVTALIVSYDVITTHCRQRCLDVSKSFISAHVQNNSAEMKLLLTENKIITQNK